MQLPSTTPAPSLARRPAAFLDAAAVEAWDAWFRWREHGVLRDVTIEQTWTRVATALAGVEHADELRDWARRFADALSCWRLLPDERLIARADAGAGAQADGLAASLNLAAFVRAPFTASASFERAAFEECAELSVRALDNAMLRAGVSNGDRTNVRIGVIGLADALALLGVSYGSAEGRAFASDAARILAHACVRGSARLARERGSTLANRVEAASHAELLGVAGEDQRAVQRHGLRFARHTEIARRPRLALFANHVADAIDPLAPEGDVVIDAPLGGDRRVRSCGYAMSLKRRLEGPSASIAVAPIGLAAQQAMRAACQPFVDRPIDYPLPVIS